MMERLHRWVWRDAGRRARKLLDFADIEEDGGRDLVRAAELTPDPILRRLYTVHAADEERHAALFRTRGTALMRSLPALSTSLRLNWVSPGDRSSFSSSPNGSRIFRCRLCHQIMAAMLPVKSAR